MLTVGGLFFSGLLLTAMACSAMLQPVPGRVPTLPVPSATAAATETAIPLYQRVVLTSMPSEEHGQPFAYTVTTQTPMLTGSEDPRVLKFNDEMTVIVNKAVTDFKNSLGSVVPSPISSASSFDLRYNLLSPPGNILSLKFDMEVYVTGAAHPYHVSQTANYDLERGLDLTLGDLFMPDADYLTALSRYCIAQLSTRDIGFEGFELGATATLQNYRSWSITSDGLMITFDEYQVAPYAAGPQIVVIPYKQLGQLIQPGGPLAAYVH
jgi:hypothetical protein